MIGLLICTAAVILSKKCKGDMAKSNNLNYRLKYDLISLKVTDLQICNFDFFQAFMMKCSILLQFFIG